MSSRKLPSKYENPVDLFFITIAEAINPLFYKLGFTANGITTLSLIFGVLFNYYYYHKKYTLATYMMIISYFFDCMDGNFARTYKMQSKFGDYYDHIKDYIVIFVFLYFLYHNNTVSKKYKLNGFIIGLLIVVCVMIYVGCQEKYLAKLKKNTHIETSEILNTFSGMCENTNNLSYIKYLGTGTFNLYLFLFIYLHNFQ